MGVNILPILAAIVCKLTTGIKRSFLPINIKALIASGTKMISETSLVTNIEIKKFIKIKSLAKLLVLATSAKHFL